MPVPVGGWSAPNLQNRIILGHPKHWARPERSRPLLQALTALSPLSRPEISSDAGQHVSTNLRQLGRKTLFHNQVITYGPLQQCFS